MSSTARTHTWTQPMPAIPTGLDLIDDLLGGGQYLRAVHGLLSFTGVGRSNLGVMLAAAGAVRQWNRREKGMSAAPWVFVTACERPARVWASALAFVAGASKTVVDTCPIGVHGSELSAIDIRPIKAVSSAQNERDMDVNSIGDRLNAAMPKLAAMMRVISVDDAEFRRGHGPIEHLLDELQTLNSSTTARVAGIVIDDVGIQLGDFRVACDIPLRAMSALVSRFVQLCHSRLADPFDSSVWLLHNLAGSRVNLPLRRLSHRDAAETRHFGDHLDACIVLGGRDRTGCFSARCTKSICRPQNLEPRRLTFVDYPWSLVQAKVPTAVVQSRIEMPAATRGLLAQLPDTTASPANRTVRKQLRPRKSHKRVP